MKVMTDPLSAPAWPPTNFSLPELWARITAMFAVLMREARSTASLAQRITTRADRHAIRCRLIPLEKLVRSLLVAEALIHLLMTPEGRALIATTKPINPPARRAQPAQTANTIQQPAKPNTTPRELPFRVLHWQMLSDVDAPLSPQPMPQDHHATGKPVSARHLARRIDALSRVMNDREPAIQRLAKFIAGLPRDALDLPATLGFTSLGWWHGRPEYFNAIALEKRAVLAFRSGGDPSEEPYDEPG